ncbi:MAG: response regulator transcription factor [Ruminococcaceae bacterium]|nr:response regulator transcription factor [Oscillospiraceae bacterium]
MKIFIVEDDENIREMETYALKNSGYDVEGFADGRSLAERLEQEIPGLILLDIMLPGDDGLTILRNIRGSERTANVPIMMVTAKTTELDKVRGLDMGADDYLTKPFGIMEMVSRVKALLRRAVPREDAPKRDHATLFFGDICMDDSSRSVTSGGAEVDLTYKEYELLKFLLYNKGIVMTRDRILSEVWGFDYEGESRTVDMHIKTLRQKLGEAGSAIKTIRSVGYKIGD